MIDLGAHGMYLADWFLGVPKTYQSVFTLSYPIEKNSNGVEDNAVTVMAYENGAIAVNETGFVSVGCPATLEVGGDKGYATYQHGGVVIKRTLDTGRKSMEVEPLPELPSPLEGFLRGEIPAGCGIDDALRLTKMMEGAYARITK